MHITLDVRNGYPMQYGSAWGLINFFPYNKDVSKEDEKLKSRCIKLHKLSMIFFIFFIFLYFIRLAEK